MNNFIYRIGFILLIVVTSSRAMAQPPYTACFTSNTVKGCAPLTVTLTNCANALAGTPQYAYNFTAQPTTVTTGTSFTYNTPGTYTIRQFVNDGIASIVTADVIVQVLSNSATPIFAIDVCLGNVVHVSITDTNYDSFTINYGDGTIVTAAQGAYTTYMYGDNLPKTISVTGNYIGATGCIASTVSRTITPLSTFVTPDIIDLTVVTQSIASGSIALRFNTIAERRYRFEGKINNGAFSNFGEITASSTGAFTQTFSSLNTLLNTYTFRIAMIDPCSNISTYSSQIASIILNASTSNGSNQITFSSNGGVSFTSMPLSRNNTQLVANATSPYNDVNVTCETDYCYQLQGVLPTLSGSGQNHRSYSAQTCVKAVYNVTTPPVVTNINSTVDGNAIKVAWDTPTLNPAVPSISFYNVQRSTGAAYDTYGSSNSTTFDDKKVSVSSQSYCYRVSYRDACTNNSGVGATTCTVLLTINRIEETNNLSWNAYTGYQTGIKEYVVENLDESGNVVLSRSVGSALLYSEMADPTLSQLIYRIKVVPNGNENLISYSNVVRLDLTPQVFMPNVFTPNGDGDNDILTIKGRYFKSAKMTILNKWGEVIFFSDDFKKGWDGSYQGTPATVDAYAYLVEALDNGGKQITLKGVVSLLR